MKSRPAKGLFLLSRILGLKTVTAQIISCIKQMEQVEPQFVFFDAEDYQRYRTWSRLNIWKNRLEAAYAFQEKIRQVGTGQYDFLFIHGYELMHGVRDMITTTPTALLTDSTDTLSHRLRYQSCPSLKNSFRVNLKNMITRPVYAPTIQHIDIFMPMSTWCARSFNHDYDVPYEKMITTHGGLDIDHWAPADTPRENRTMHLLFVGNDLRRKGGQFILDVFDRHLKDICELTIISGDPDLKKLPHMAGVNLIPGIENHRLVELFNACDLFVFPTFNDKSPNVLKEAAAAGLPIIARDVGGVSEIVQHGCNGYLMPYTSNEADWGKSIRTLLQNKQQLAQFAAASRVHAMQHFSLERFKCDLTEVISRLTQLAHVAGKS